MSAPSLSGETYPRECLYCTWGAALACSDSECRERGFGEHRDDCASLANKAALCDCLRDELEPQ